MHRILLTIGLVAGLAVVPAGHAANAGFLDHSPITYFTESDMDTALATAREALDDAADGESRSWINPENGNSGSYTPMATGKKGDRICRDLRVEHDTPKASGSSRFLVCQQTDGSWKIE